MRRGFASTPSTTGAARPRDGGDAPHDVGPGASAGAGSPAAGSASASAAASAPGSAAGSAAGSGATLSVDGLELGYGSATIVRGVSARFEPGTFTAVIGPNGCGKSTLLRSLARLLPPRAGSILLNGREAGSWKAKEYARHVALLSQEGTAPSGISVAQLVARGRYPHHGLLQQFGAEDEEIVRQSLAATGVLRLSASRVSELSGGQRQRVRVATALAQRTPVLLLDEPTTFLDVAHQVDLLDLFAAQRDAGATVVAVLHDLNQAMRYADRLIVMEAGRVVAQGAPGEVMSAELLAEVFNVRSEIHEDPVTGGPMMVTVPRAGAVLPVA